MNKGTIEQPTMHKTGTREEWLAARRDCSGRKRVNAPQRRAGGTAAGTAVGAIDKEYRSRPTKEALLADLFRGRSQLLLYHFMFGPDYTAGCPVCSSIADGFNGGVVHLAKS